jgi:ArsR family transcriptional regulator
MYTPFYSFLLTVRTDCILIKSLQLKESKQQLKVLVRAKILSVFLHSMRLKHFNIELGAQIFLASSDTSRLRILNLILTNGEMCITDLERILEFTQTKTSRHLLYLKNSGILTSRKINQWAFYQIKDEVFDLVKQILQFVSRDPVMQQDQSVFKTMYSNRELSLNKLSIKPLTF